MAFLTNHFHGLHQIFLFIYQNYGPGGNNFFKKSMAGNGR